MDQVPSGAVALTALIESINMRPTEGAAYTAVRVLTGVGVHTPQTESTVTVTAVAAFIADLLHMEADVLTAQAELMHTKTSMDPSS